MRVVVVVGMVGVDSRGGDPSVLDANYPPN